MIKWISKFTTYLAECVSKISRPDPVIADADLTEIRDTLKPGDCLVTRTNYELSNTLEKILTGSFYGHAAIYLDGMIYEATTKRVRKISLERFVFIKDGIGVCRLPGSDWTDEQLKSMKDFCDSQLGDEYDFSFNWGQRKKWYCSKLVWFAWDIGKPQESEAIKSNNLLGMKKVIPQNIWDSAQKIKTFGVIK